MRRICLVFIQRSETNQKKKKIHVLHLDHFISACDPKRKKKSLKTPHRGFSWRLARLPLHLAVFVRPLPRCSTVLVYVLTRFWPRAAVPSCRYQPDPYGSQWDGHTDGLGGGPAGSDGGTDAGSVAARHVVASGGVSHLTISRRRRRMI